MEKRIRKWLLFILTPNTYSPTPWLSFWDEQASQVSITAHAMTYNLPVWVTDWLAGWLDGWMAVGMSISLWQRVSEFIKSMDEWINGRLVAWLPCCLVYCMPEYQLNSFLKCLFSYKDYNDDYICDRQVILFCLCCCSCCFCKILKMILSSLYFCFVFIFIFFFWNV